MQLLPSFEESSLGDQLHYAKLLLNIRSPHLLVVTDSL
jgi:hypothetical protein